MRSDLGFAHRPVAASFGLRAIRRLRRFAADRMARHQLAALSDDMLADIGLRRQDVESAYLGNPWREVDWEELDRVRGHARQPRLV